MPSLADTQRRFHAAMLADEDTSLHAEIAGQDLPPEISLTIYRNNIFASLINALGDLYPVIHKLVGREFFRATAREYVRAYPPAHGRLNAYGGDFGDFLKRFPPAARLPYLGDVAALEWAWQEAYLAAEATPVAAADIEPLAPEDTAHLVFDFHPSARLVRSRFPIIKIWEANMGQENSDQTIDLDSGGETALVIRPEGEVLVRRLQPAAADMTAALMQGEPLAQAYDAALAADPEFDIANYLAVFLGGDSFVGVQPAT